MPVKTLTAPGDTAGVNLLKNGSDYDVVHDATAGTNAGNTDNKFTLHAKAGANYFVRRGILLYDFRDAPIKSGIKVIRAQLIANDVSELAPQAGGDKVRVAWIFDPNTFGSFHANDYSKTRYATLSYSSAQQLDNAADGEIINLDNRMLLNRLQRALNQKTYLHLVVRNELDYQDTTPTGNNRVWFDRPNADDAPLQLRVFYRIMDATRNTGGPGTGRTSKSGFGGIQMFCGTNSGFGSD